MKIKTSELAGPALDWAVAKCEGVEIVQDQGGYSFDHYYPSIDWAQGGPIIDREIHAFDHMQSKQGLGVTAIIKRKDMRNGGWNHGYGPTPLIAAMRCYVDMKLGDEIDIPDSLA